MSQARKIRRSAVQGPRQDDGTPPLSRVGMVAGISLGLSDEQATDALNALAGFRPTDATAGALFARMLELVDLARREGIDYGLPAELNTAAERAKLDRSFGAGFAKRVTGVGQPAVSLLGALRSLLLLLALFLWPSHANAAGALVQTAHKIQRRNSGRLARRNLGRRVGAHYHHPRGWIRSRAKFGDSPPLFTSFHSFATGSGRGRTSCGSRARSSKSYSFGGVDVFTSVASPRVTRTSRFNGATARSNSRPSSNPGGC